MSDDYTDQPETYWEQDAVNDRDEYDQHLRAVELEERERVTDHGD
jgi:hypothetical protein